MKHKLGVQENSECCSFCLRGKEHGLDGIMGSRHTPAMICVDCTTGFGLVFAREAELKVQAEKIAEEVDWKNNRRDKDGQCNCPNCTLNRLEEADPVLHAIDQTLKAITRGEAVSGTKH